MAGKNGLEELVYPTIVCGIFIAGGSAGFFLGALNYFFSGAITLTAGICLVFMLKTLEMRHFSLYFPLWRLAALLFVALAALIVHWLMLEYARTDANSFRLMFIGNAAVCALVILAAIGLRIVGQWQWLDDDSANWQQRRRIIDCERRHAELQRRVATIDKRLERLRTLRSRLRKMGSDKADQIESTMVALEQQSVDTNTLSQRYRKLADELRLEIEQDALELLEVHDDNASAGAVIEHEMEQLDEQFESLRYLREAKTELDAELR